MRQDQADLLRRLALSDDDALRGALEGTIALGHRPLPPRTVAAVRLAALIGLGAAESSYVWAVAVALAAGVADEELVGVLGAVAHLVEPDQRREAANKLALALGHDLDGPDGA